MKVYLIVTVLLVLLNSITSADIRHNRVTHVAHVDQYRRGDTAPVPPAHSKSPAPVAPTTPVNTVPAICGNGVIEHGEECDCGSPEECAKDPCCNAKTCKLALGAQCSNQQDCCDKCQFRLATFVCRAATADCDSAEMCTGKSAKCPADKKDCPKHHSSTTSNSTDTKADASCGSVPCSSRDLQCQTHPSTEINFTKACTEDISSCQISCEDPGAAALTGSARCLSLSAYFTDGTECGQGGVCTNGSCSGDKGTQSFFKKNVLLFAIGGGGIVVALLLCFISIFCLRQRKRTCNKEERHGDLYQMSETSDHSRRSNIRIGLDPVDNGLIDVLPPYDSKQTVRAGGPSRESYAPGSLMTEQEMVQELESDSNQKMSPSKSTWPTAPMLHSLPYRGPPPAEKANTWVGVKNSGSTLLKSTSNHTVYVPPPLPPITLTSPLKVGVTSPYADDAMIVFPPDSPPPPVVSAGFKSVNSDLSVVESQTPTKDDCEMDDRRRAAAVDDDDEPSMLQLDNTLTVDRYTKGGGVVSDRASVSSFFSTLAIDPEPVSLTYPTTPPLSEPSFASEEFIMPAPVARIAPTPPATTTKTVPRSSSSSTSSSSTAGNQKSAYERKQEEIKVATCFAQDLGFEIVNPSPMTSPRQGATHPMD